MKTTIAGGALSAEYFTSYIGSKIGDGKNAPCVFIGRGLRCSLHCKTVRNKDLSPGSKNNHDTIGMIAMDAQGNLSDACTTSGMAFKMHGRVGDSPIIGSGLYVDNEVGGATATGVGEEVIRVVGSHLVVELMWQGRYPEEACKEAVTRIAKRHPGKARSLQEGFVALNKEGAYGAYCLQRGFSYAVQSNSVSDVFTARSLFP